MADWISPLAEQALSRFLCNAKDLSPTSLTDASQLDLVEDGSNLRFRDPTQRSAQIVEVS
jgi:hypothetical protein